MACRCPTDSDTGRSLHGKEAVATAKRGPAPSQAGIEQQDPAPAESCLAKHGVGPAWPRGSRAPPHARIRSRAGFGVMPAWSKTMESTVTVFRIVARALPAADSAATSAATSAGVIVSTGRSRSGWARLSAERWYVTVASVTSTREAFHRSAIVLTVRAATGSASPARFGTRSAASSPSTHHLRATASPFVPNDPACPALDSRPPSR